MVTKSLSKVAKNELVTFSTYLSIGKAITDPVIEQKWNECIPDQESFISPGIKILSLNTTIHEKHYSTRTLKK
jgi:hypothetical protein